MTLFPLQAFERNPIGLFPLAASVAIEGGMVGEIVAAGGAGSTPEVDIMSDSGAGTKQLSLVGLLDDSTSGAGYGGAVFGTPINAGTTEATGTPAGPASHFASGKATIWTDSGLYATDVFDSSLSDLTGLTPGDLLYSGTGGSAGLLITGLTDEIGRFVRRFEGGIGSVDAFDSFFMPRVQPQLAGSVYMIFKFK